MKLTQSYEESFIPRMAEGLQTDGKQIANGCQKDKSSKLSFLLSFCHPFAFYRYPFATPFFYYPFAIPFFCYPFAIRSGFSPQSTYSLAFSSLALASSLAPSSLSPLFRVSPPPPKKKRGPVLRKIFLIYSVMIGKVI